MPANGTLVITSVAEASSGGGQHILHHLRGVRARGIELGAVVLRAGSLYSALSADGIRTHLVPVSGIGDVRGIGQLRSVLAQEQPAIVHTHGERAMFVGNWLARSTGVPAIVTTVHRSIPRTTTWPLWRRAAYTLAEDATLRWATTCIVAVSRSMRDELVNSRGHATSRIAVIHNGVTIPAQAEIDRFASLAGSLRHALDLPADSFVVGSVGRLASEKGYSHLLTAMAAIVQRESRAYLVLVGDGPQRHDLAAKSRMLGIEHHVRFAGQQADVRPWLALFDVFVSPSPWESFGIAVAEAQAVGLPVVATCTSGPAEYIEHGVSGLLVPAGEASALAEAVLGLLRSPQLCQELGRKGREVISCCYSVDRMVDGILAAYNALLSRGE